MSNKTLDDLVKQVVDSQAGLMSVDDLKVFFEDTPQANVQPNRTAGEPASAPTPQASAATPASATVEPSIIPAEPVVSQPDILNFMPEKFKSGDAKTSIEKMAMSYAELEAELKKEREEKANLDNMLKTFTEPSAPSSDVPSTPAVPTMVTPEGEEVTDSSFFDAPTASSRKIAQEVAGAMFQAYHKALQETSKRVQYVENFKATHPDFNEYREEMAEILRARPDLDKKVESLPLVYELSKQRHKAKLEKMRKELGMPESAIPTPQPAPAVSQVTEAELVEKVKAALYNEVQKRKGATGITGGGSPTSPVQRVQEVQKEKPMTEGDQIFADMLAAGRNKLALDLS